jgi:anti-sigma regulatory factor (Ser/Thr protein kinase)
VSQTFFKSDDVQNTVRLFGDLRLNSLGYVTAAIHRIRRAGWSDIVLDFREVTTLTHSVIPPLAAHLRSLVRDFKIDFDYVSPRQPTIAKRITELGLSHYICHRQFKKPKLNSSDPSVLQFLDQSERELAVDKVLNSALRRSDLKRQHLAALEWAVNEVTDNVLTHSKSGVGGFLICHKIHNMNILEFTVADAGIGVARSLGIDEDVEALERAVQEGVTRNKSTNQGNGLYGAYQLSLASQGVFVIRSGYGNLFVDKGAGGMHLRRENIPFRGTYVVCQIDCSDHSLVEKALVIGGRPYQPSYDFIERKHENDDGTLKIHARELCATFGSRQSGAEARRYLKNVMSSSDNARVEVDFSDVFVVSSSFADEVFGKLFVEMGPMAYMRRITLTNTVSAVESLIDRAITLRAQSGL